MLPLQHCVKIVHTTIVRNVVIPFNLIVPSAGSGTRSKQQIPKQFVKVCGKTVLRRSVERFLGFGKLATLVIPIQTDWRDPAVNGLEGIREIMFADGGEDRQESIRNGLQHVQEDVPVTLVHDAARPFVSHEVIARVIDVANSVGASIPVVPVRETVKRVRNDRVVTTEDRRELFLAQTPQAFRTEILIEAYKRASEAGDKGTDDASLVERLGQTVQCVPGNEFNVKLTYPSDFDFARWLIESGRFA
jgi:2-C-methyl-D-erythritol 4-phosphate cytidylyltransferase